MRISVLRLFLLVTLSVSHTALAQQLSPGDGLRRVTAKDLGDALVALVNINAPTGMAGFTIDVDERPPQSTLKYDKLALSLPLSWATDNPKIDIVGEIGLGGLNMTDAFFVNNTVGQRILIDADRDFVSAGAGVGFSYMPTTEWRITPVVEAFWNHFDNKVRVSGGSLDLGDLTPAQRASISNFDTQAYSVTGGLEVKFDRWFGDQDYRLEISGHYVHVYSETYDESTPVVKASGHTDIVSLTPRWTVVTDHTLFGVPLAWSLNARYTSFIGQSRALLGFNEFFEVGAGIELHIRKHIFDEPINSVGLEFTSLFGDDISGFGIAITIRN